MIIQKNRRIPQKDPARFFKAALFAKQPLAYPAKQDLLCQLNRIKLMMISSKERRFLSQRFTKYNRISQGHLVSRL